MKLVCLDAYTVYPADDKRWDAFRSIADIEVYDRTSASELRGRVADADAILTNKVPVDAALIDACPSLKYIGVLATGFNIVDVAAARKSGIVVANIPAYSTDSVAQHVFSLLLAYNSRAEHYAEAVSGGRWSACHDFSFRDFEWHELAGKTMGIVGLGNIGGRVAHIATAFGMKVLVSTSKTQEMLPHGFRKASLDEVFADADVVSLHCPLTAETAALVDARRLSLMKPSAVLINTARGGLIDENALACALKEGRLAGACLDVLSTEPPSEDNPLLSAPNCLITPHIAWASDEARRRLFDIALANFKAFLSGQVINRVD